MAPVNVKRTAWVLLLTFLLGVGPVGADDILVPDLKWMVLDDNNVGPALYAPVEPANPHPQESEAYWQFELGRAAFRSPTLLGGLAAREGMSCHSCHQSGGTNPHFFVDALSSDPGTFDPTNSLFSTHTEDGIDNPVRIPTLFDVADTAPYPSDGRFETLNQMVTHVIKKEFDGLTPPDEVSRALLAYLSNLHQPKEEQLIALTPSSELQDVERMIALMRRTIDDSDQKVFGFLVNTTRRKLGTIYNRFTEQESVQHYLLNWSEVLKEARDLIAAGDKTAATNALNKIELSDAVLAEFESALPGSLYDEEALRDYIAQLNVAQ